MFSASAYIKDNRLCILGVHDTKSGPIPFSHSCACEGSDGPIDIGSEQLAEPLAKALDESQKVIMANIKRDEIRLAAESLVDRSRAGDQNATGMIIEVRKNAASGNKRAVVSLQFMKQYASRTKNDNTSISGDTDEHPKLLNPSSALSTEIQKDEPNHYLAAIKGIVPSLSCVQAAVALSSGPQLNKSRIETLLNNLTDEEKEQFSNGFARWANTRIKIGSDGEKIGKCIALAQKIQMVRSGRPIAVLSKRAGWELD